MFVESSTRKWCSRSARVNFRFVGNRRFLGASCILQFATGDGVMVFFLEPNYGGNVNWNGLNCFKAGTKFSQNFFFVFLLIQKRSKGCGASEKAISDPVKCINEVRNHQSDAYFVSNKYPLEVYFVFREDNYWGGQVDDNIHANK